VDQRLLFRDDSVNSLAISSDGETLVVGNFQAITMWDIPSGQMIGRPLVVPGEVNGGIVYSVVFSADWKWLASGDNLGIISLWDIYEISWRSRACRFVTAI
jgi:WD40 repeat protein